MARNATAVHRYLVRVPGARHIKVQQQKQDVSPGGRRVWANIRARNVDPRADPATYVEATTKRGFRAPWQWKDQFKVTATFGTGATENKKTWRFTIRSTRSMTLRCSSCVAAAGPPPAKPLATRHTPFATRHTGVGPAVATTTFYTPTGNGAGFASFNDGGNGNGFATLGTGGNGTGNGGIDLEACARYPDHPLCHQAAIDEACARYPDHPLCQDDSVTDSLTVNPDLDNATEEETQEIAYELDDLVDGGAVVEVPEETEDALAEVEGEVPDAPLSLPFDVPPSVEPYVAPAAGALVGAVAGRFFGDRTALGAVLGVVAGYLYKESR